MTDVLAPAPVAAPPIPARRPKHTYTFEKPVTVDVPPDYPQRGKPHVFETLRQRRAEEAAAAATKQELEEQERQKKLAAAAEQKRLFKQQREDVFRKLARYVAMYNDI